MSEEKCPITADDLYQFITVEDPSISPDGQWIAYVRVTVDKMENGYKRTIWLSSTSGGEPRQLTRSGKDSQPRWSPDGNTLAFISSRDGKPQIYLLPIAAPGGEPRPLTSALNGVSGLTWSPEGTQIAYLSSMNATERHKEDRGEKDEPPKDKLDGKHRNERREEDEKKRLDPYPVARIPYRSGTSFLGDRYSQIYVLPTADGLATEDAKPRRLTDIDANHDVPQWSADSAFIYTSRQIDPAADEPFRHGALFRIHTADGQHEQITGADHSSLAPLISPDGKLLVYFRFPQVHNMYEFIDRLTVLPIDGGEPRDLNLELNQGVSEPSWTSDSSTLIFAGGTQGNSPIYKVTLSSGKIETILDGTLRALQLGVGKKGEIAYTASTPLSPAELYYLAADTTEPVQLTHFNRDFLNSLIIQPPNEFRFISPDDIEIQGWYVLPVGYQEGQKYPLVLHVHGGPHIMWGPSDTSMFHEWQFHAARGYIVFYCNPRGSDGYGQEFRWALHKAWGDVAYKDVMAGVDALLQKGFIDETRMGVIGGSYGGYLTTWIISHTNRFCTAVSQRGVYNLVSFYGTSDVPSLISGEFDVNPWEDHELLWKHSPLAYAHNIKTPLLIEHSENDYRVPIEQGEQMFAFIRRSGGTVEMLRYPREGHELSRSGEPEHRVIRLIHTINWFDKYCKEKDES